MSFGTRYGFSATTSQTPQTPASFSIIGNNTAAFTNFLTSVYKSEEILEPTEILGVYSSSEMMQKGIFMKLIDIFPLKAHGMLMWINTNTPLKTSN